MSNSTGAAQLSSDQEARRALAIWRSPEDFRDLVEILFDRTKSPELFNSPRKKYLLDAWTLAEVTRHLTVDRIRLQEPEEQWPDGYIEINGAQKNVEVTSAHMPGRRLGEEYRDVVDMAVEHYPDEDWNKRAEAIVEALDRAIREKAAKRYSSPFILVVYLNLGEHGFRQAKVEREIRCIKAGYRERFEQLHVLWKDKLL
jgi:hypothetical protein